MFAVANSALINMLMASRLIYGMARQRVLPPVLGKVHPTRRTPWVAIVFTTALAFGLIVFVSFGNPDAVATLGGTTALLLLGVFAVVNVAVLVLRKDNVGKKHFRAPTVLPIIGFITCLYLVTPLSGRAVGAVRRGRLAAGDRGGAVLRHGADQQAAGDLAEPVPRSAGPGDRRPAELTWPDRASAGRAEQLIDRREIVGQHARAADEGLQLGAGQGRVVVAAGGVARQDRRHRDRLVGGDQNRLPPAVPASRSGGAISATCSKTAPRVAASARAKPSGGWSIRLIDVDPVGSQHPVDLLDELPGGQVPRHGQPAERVADHQVVGVVGRLPDAQPGVADPDLQVRRGLQAEFVLGRSAPASDRVRAPGWWSRGWPTAGSAAW